MRPWVNHRGRDSQQELEYEVCCGGKLSIPLAEAALTLPRIIKYSWGEREGLPSLEVGSFI